MNIEAFFKNNPDVKKWMKWGGTAVVVLWIVREIFMMTMFNSMFHFVTGGINSQEAAMKSMEEDAEEHIQNVEKGMQGVVNGIQEGAKEMNQKLEQMEKDFEKAGEVEESLKHGFEDIKKFSDETAKEMFEENKRSAKEFKKKSDEFMHAAIENNEKEKKKARLQAKKEWEMQRKKKHDETGLWLPTYEELNGNE